MPSYKQRGLKVCPKCNAKTSQPICTQCGCETQECGKWSVRFKVKESGRVVNKRLSGFDSRAEAERAYLSFVGTGVGRRSFADLVGEYFEQAERSLKGSTIYNKKQIFNLHILPFFRDYTLQEVNKALIIEWRQGLMTKKNAKTGEFLSIMYINSMRADLCAFYSFLEDRYDCLNVVKQVKPLKKSAESFREMNFYDLSEFKRLLRQISRCKKKRMRYLYHAFFSMLYFTGARVGEIVALAEDDIDFESGQVSITKSLTRKTPKGVPFKITSPKNSASIRKITMSRQLVASLRAYIDWKRANGISGKFLFCGDNPLGAHSYNLAFKNFRQSAGLKKIRIHDFRHSHASLLINLGANVTLVSRRLGHRNTQQTLNTYSHLFPSSEREIVNLLNKM